MIWLDLHNNLLTGTIPKWVGHLKGIEVIDLSSNLLTGAIFDGNNVSSLFNIENGLWMLDLSENMLSGEIQFGKIPPDIGLQILSLRDNHFSGPIRSQLCELKSLLVLELSQNHLTGHIPPCLGSMPFDYIMEISNAPDIQVIEIVKGIVEVSTGTRGGQSIIDLSSNYLVGTIPEELTNIVALFALNLSYNHLTGHIPGNIGNLKRVESLDLSNNHLSGTIPQSLSSISWLSKLNLSNNKLHGPIPSGSQLQTLDDPSIYAGNSDLCGFPLPNDCAKPTARKDDVGKEDKYDKTWFILAVMSGVATGFWGVVGTLVINRSWRHAYFRYVEDLGDRIYVPIKVRVNMFKNQEEFSDLQTSIYGEIRNLVLSGRNLLLKELEAVDISVTELYPMIQEDKEPAESDDFQKSFTDLGNKVEKLSSGLDLLTKEIDGFFQIVMSGRDALLCNLRVSSAFDPPKKYRKEQEQLLVR